MKTVDGVSFRMSDIEEDTDTDATEEEEDDDDEIDCDSEDPVVVVVLVVVVVVVVVGKSERISDFCLPLDEDDNDDNDELFSCLFRKYNSIRCCAVSKITVSRAHPI